MNYDDAKAYAESHPKRKAIAEADAHTNNAGLPTYSELAQALREAASHTDHLQSLLSKRQSDRVYEDLKGYRALLSRIPS